MSITINKEEIFATETIDKAGLTSDFEQFAKSLNEKKQEAEKAFNARTAGSAFLGMGSLSIASASLQSILPSSPTLVSACLAVGVAGGLGIAALELMKKKKIEKIDDLKTPYNFFKEKMEIEENEDGTLDLSMKSSLLEKELKQTPVKIIKLKSMMQKREKAIEEIESLGLSNDFKAFAEKNSENHINAQNSYDPLKGAMGVLGAGGLTAATAQIQYKLSTATTMSDHSIQNIMSSENPLLIGAGLVGVAGMAGFSVSSYIKNKKLSKMEDDINNPHKFLKELESMKDERDSVFVSNMEMEENSLINSLKVNVVEEERDLSLNNKAKNKQKLN